MASGVFTALAAAVEPKLVGDVGADGADHHREAGGHGAHEEHARREDEELARREEGKDDQAQRIDGGVHDQGAVLADPVRQPGGEGRPGETGGHIDQQQQIGLGRVEAAAVLEV